MTNPKYNLEPTYESCPREFAEVRIATWVKSIDYGVQALAVMLHNMYPGQEGRDN